MKFWTHRWVPDQNKQQHEFMQVPWLWLKNTWSTNKKYKYFNNLLLLHSRLQVFLRFSCKASTWQHHHLVPQNPSHSFLTVQLCWIFGCWSPWGPSQHERWGYWGWDGSTCTNRENDEFSVSDSVFFLSLWQGYWALSGNREEKVSEKL